jgi:hypothetical protein
MSERREQAMADHRGIMPADFLAERRAEGERLRAEVARLSCHLAVVVVIAVVILLPLLGAVQARRARAEEATRLLREAEAVTISLKTRAKSTERLQSWYAAVDQARVNRRLWLSFTAAMANYLPLNTWLTGAACAEEAGGIKAELSGAAWSVDSLPRLTAAWAADPTTRGAPTLRSIRTVTLDDLPAVRFELALRYGGPESPTPEAAP